jgi:hypothetical protein
MTASRQTSQRAPLEAFLRQSMPSNWPSTIPLYNLPFLNSQNARNGEILNDQPAIGRRPLLDGDEEGEEEEEGEADRADSDRADRDAERLAQATASRAARTRGARGARGALSRARSGSNALPPSIVIKPAWRLHLYNLLERPNSSAAAVLVHVVVTALIVFSALVTILETVPGTLRSLPGGIWFGLETSLVALFTVEYVARFAATSYSWSGLFGWVFCASFLFFLFFFLLLWYYPLALFVFSLGAMSLDPDFVSQHQRSLELWTF